MCPSSGMCQQLRHANAVILWWQIWLGTEQRKDLGWGMLQKADLGIRFER